jgi:hypothetical protein
MRQVHIITFRIRNTLNEAERRTSRAENYRFLNEVQRK